MEVVLRPDMEVGDRVDVYFLSGCCLEAQRCDTVVLQLEGLRISLNDSSTEHLTLIVDEIRASGRYLRELADLSQIHQTRVLIVLNHLNVVLPCLSRSLRDITSYYEDQSKTKKNRWRAMYHNMMEEADGSTLAQRFSIFNYFLTSLRDILIRSPSFDLNGLNNAENKIMQVRGNQGIPPPLTPIGPRMRASLLAFEMDSALHWAQQIFSIPLPSRTALKNQIGSVAAGPHEFWGQLSIEPNATILFRRPFNDDQICLIGYLVGRNQSPHLLLRSINPGTGEAFFSQRGCHELCIERDGCILRFNRWSQKSYCAKTWAALNFLTWEELILMYCSFLSLKARNMHTISLNPKEFDPCGEKKLFQGRISDDGFWHSLIVYKDLTTGGIRLLAAVWDGDLRKCPVWTAFVTHQAASPTWVRRVGSRTIRLADIQLYVFCQEYRQQRQRRGQAGVFEINFHTEKACDAFVDLFPIEPKRPRTPRQIDQ